MAGNTWHQHLPGPLVDIEILGDSRQVDNMLTSIANAFDDQMIAYDFLRDHVDPMLRRRTADRFASEGDEMSGPWAPLADATVRIRGSAHPINVRTGAMRGHLVNTPPRIVTHSLGATMWSPGPSGSVEMDKKVKTAQIGGQTPEGRNVPPRPVLGVDERDAELVLVEMAQYLAKHVASGGAQVNFL